MLLKKHLALWFVFSSDIFFFDYSDITQIKERVNIAPQKDLQNKDIIWTLYLFNEVIKTAQSYRCT